MAELIDKGALVRELESVSFTEDAKKMNVGSDAEMDGFFKGYVEGMLYFIPTTTEAEIRAKAIDEAIEEMKRWVCVTYGLSDVDLKEIDEIAEQLKGGEE